MLCTWMYVNVGKVYFLGFIEEPQGEKKRDEDILKFFELIVSGGGEKRIKNCQAFVCIYINTLFLLGISAQIY